jgi:hypothetical protein
LYLVKRKSVLILQATQIVKSTNKYSVTNFPKISQYCMFVFLEKFSKFRIVSVLYYAKFCEMFMLKFSFSDKSTKKYNHRFEMYKLYIVITQAAKA